MKRAVMMLSVLVCATMLAFYLFFSPQPEPKSQEAQVLIRVYENALSILRADTGTLPSSESGIRQLVSNLDSMENWQGPYVGLIKSDPWGNSFIYKRIDISATGYHLYSSGENGIDENGRGDDIN